MTRTFGLALRELRRAKGLSQRELADKVGVDFSYISKVENDRIAPPSADTIIKIAEALESPPAELLVLTRKVPTSMREMVGGSAAALHFMREAQSMRLSEAEWQKLSMRLKRLRD